MSITAVLEALRKEYAVTLQDEVRNLDAAVHADDLSAARRLAHRVAGTAGSYGFKESSDAARRIEEAIAANDTTAMLAALAELKNRAEIAYRDIG